MSNRHKIQYDLSNFDRTEFELSDRLVRSVILANGRPPYSRSLRRITTDRSTLSKTNVNYIEQNLDTLDAVCFEKPNGDFDIWVSPELDPEVPFYRQTLLHELSHGYLGVSNGHNHLWKKLYSRVLLHHHNLVEDLGDIHRVINSMLVRYTKKASSETDQQLGERVLADQRRYSHLVIAEIETVSNLYNRMCDKEYNAASVA